MFFLRLRGQLSGTRAHFVKGVCRSNGSILSDGTCGIVLGGHGKRTGSCPSGIRKWRNETVTLSDGGGGNCAVGQRTGNDGPDGLANWNVISGEGPYRDNYWVDMGQTENVVLGPELHRTLTVDNPYYTGPAPGSGEVMENDTLLVGVTHGDMQWPSLTPAAARFGTYGLDCTTTDAMIYMYNRIARL